MAPQKVKLLDNGMYPDGSNPEGVDPVPELNWKSKDDFQTNVVLWGIGMSPAVTKLMVYLKYYKIPFDWQEAFTKKGSKYYKLMPVLDVGDRTVNDTFVIIKNLVTAMEHGDTNAFDEEWERRITFGFQMSTLLGTDEDVRCNINAPQSGFPLPRCLHFLLFKIIRPKFLKRLEARMEDPNEPIHKVDLTEFCKEFKSAMADKDFFGGTKPSQVDLSLYGCCARYLYAGCPSVTSAIQDSGLSDWCDRMKKLIPLSGSPDAIFP